MNRNLYRLVFNAARGQVMVVAEVAVARTAGDNKGTGLAPAARPSRPLGPAPVRAWARSTLASVCALLVALPPGQMAARAQVVADPQAAASLRPQILGTANGVTQVNIQTPSAAGVSRNVYSQFDIDQRGAILNNATAAAQTQIGGWVQANGNLSAGSARVILNEVNATSPSQLRGYVEVAGQRAEVVIANPAGIAVNGGGFINASAVTLTTGTPILNSGSLEGYRVNRGTIQIQGSGLDANGADYARILARAVEVNAGLWAQHLKVVAGAHQSDADASTISPLAPDAGTTTPQYALDVSALGGMYAGKITLIGTEAGLGVNNRGNISAHSGNIVLLADGTLTNAGQIQAQDKLTVRAANLDNTGNLLANGVLEANATDPQGHISNSGSIIGSSVTLQAPRNLTNSGPQALIGATDAAGRLTLLSEVITNADDVTATDAMPTTTLFGAGEVVLAGGVDNHGAYTRASNITNRSGLIESGRGMTLAAQTVSNTRRTLVMGSAYDQAVDSSIITALGISLSGQVGQINTPDPDNIGGVYIDPPHGGLWNSDYLYTTYSGTAGQNVVQAISPPAQIVSGSDLTILATTLQNRWSLIASGRDVNLGNATLDQESWQGAERAQIKVAYSGSYIYRTYRGWIWSHSFCDSGCSAGGDTRYYVRTDHEPSLSASGTIRGAGGAIINGTSSSGLVAPPPSTVSNPSLTLPGGGLFRVTANPSASYLVESDLRFTSYQQWLSSDYLLTALSLDPNAMQKRLGDGYYEQRLVREQLLQLTGRQLLAGANSLQDSYQALLNNAVTYAQAHNLQPGIALSAQQMAQLTSDIVWLVEREITLPDGRKTTALVPQVYLSQVSANNLRRDGALIAATDIDLQGLQGLSNGGTLQASRDLTLQSQTNLSTSGGTLSAGRQMILYAANNIELNNARLQAGSLTLTAGQNLRMETLSSTQTHNTGSLTTLGRQTDVRVTGDAAIRSGGDTRLTGVNLTVDGNLDLQTGGKLEIGTAQTRETKTVQRFGGSASSDFTQNIGSSVVVGGNTKLDVTSDMTIAGSTLQLGSQAGNTAVVHAGGNVNLTAAKDSGRIDSSWSTGGTVSSQGQYSRLDETVRGASLASSGKLSITAGKDVNLAGSAINAAGVANIQGAGDINVTTVQERHTSFLQAQGSRSGLMRSTQSQERNQQASTLAKSSEISGQSVVIASAQDLNIQGSNVLADQDIKLKAAGNVRIAAAQDTSDSSSFAQTARSGLMSSGLSITAGQQQQSLDQQGQSTRAVASTVGSTGGNVSIAAGRSYAQTGSDVLTPTGDIDITAQKVDITEARETSSQGSEHKFRQSGLTLAITSPVISTLQAARSQLQAADNTQSSRMQALATANAAMNARQAAGAVQAGQGMVKGRDGKMVEGNAADKVGGIGVSISVGSSSSSSQQQSSADTARGSSVSAGGDVSIRASGAGTESDLTLQGSDVMGVGKTSLEADGEVNLLAAANTTTESSRNSSKSGSVGLGIQMGAGGGMGIIASAARGSGQGDGQSTTYSNSHVQGQEVKIASGGDATLKGAVVKGERVSANVGGKLTIQSLQDSSQYREDSKSAGASVMLGAGGGGSLSLAQSRIHSDYQSVGEQSAIRAGDGGFQVQVGGDTVLTGAQITSTQTAIDNNKNSFTTGGTLTTTDLHNTASFEAKSMSVGLGAGTPSPGAALSAGLSGIGLGSDKGSASSISTAGISGVAGHSTARTGDRETGLQEIFNKEKVRSEVSAQTAITGEFGKQASKAVGDYAATQLKNAQDAGDQAGMDAWKEGGAKRVALHTLVGGLTAGAAGAVGAGTASAAAPKLEELQTSLKTALKDVGVGDSGANLIASLAGGATAATIGAAVSGGSETGSATAFNADMNNRQLHPTEIQWIRQNARRFAQQQGLSEQEAEQRLAQQAFREVQFGVAGATDGAAQAFLKNGTQGMLLPSDPNVPGQNVGYMFYATPDQKTNVGMYATQVVSGSNALAFYTKNGITQPTQQQVQEAAIKNAASRATFSKATLGAAGASLGITMPTVLSLCLSNPVACNRIVIAGGEIAGGEALGPAGLGIGGVAAAQAGLKAMRSAEEVNVAMRAAGDMPAWSPGTAVISAELKPGTRVNMIVDADTAKGIADAQRTGNFSQVRLGGWATFDDVSSVAVDMRQKAAITGEFKPTSSGPFYVVELEVKKPFDSNIGFAGSQINKEKLPGGDLTTLNTTLRGAASQAELLIPKELRTQFLQPISIPKELGR